MPNGAGITRASRASDQSAIEDTGVQKFFIARGRYGGDIVQKIEYLPDARSRRGVLAFGKAVQVSGGWSNGAGLTLPVRSQAKKSR